MQAASVRSFGAAVLDGHILAVCSHPNIRLGAGWNSPLIREIPESEIAGSNPASLFCGSPGWGRRFINSPLAKSPSKNQERASHWDSAGRRTGCKNVPETTAPESTDPTSFRKPGLSYPKQLSCKTQSKLYNRRGRYLRNTQYPCLQRHRSLSF